LSFDATCGGADLARKDGVVDDSTLLDELGPHVPWKAEMRSVVAVEMADLAGADLEGELAAPARPRFDAGPRGDLLDDLLARGLCRAHVFLRSVNRRNGSRGVSCRHFQATVQLQLMLRSRHDAVGDL
jgi:hypothetical protein